MGSLGLLVEACKTCDDSYNSHDQEDVGQMNISLASSISNSDDQTNSNVNSLSKEDENIPPIHAKKYPNVLYCKARGMPFDHEGENAYLLFNDGEERKHGSELKCSYPQCRANGIKFRYCAVCKKAVAKRNFRKRHAHPEEINWDLLPLQHSTPRPTKMHCREGMPFRSIENINNSEFYHMHEETNMKNPMNSQKGSSLPPMQDDASFTSQHMNSYGNEKVSCKFNFENYNHPSQSINHQAESQDPMLTKYSVPQPWIDLFHSRPTRGNKEQLKSWLFRAMDIANICNNDNGHGSCNTYYDNSVKSDSSPILEDQQSDKSDIIETNDTMVQDSWDTSSLAEVRDEFAGSIPPRFMSSFEHSAQLDDSSSTLPLQKFKDHAKSMSLQINTDIDHDVSGCMMLDSAGSMIITPRS